MNTTLALLMLMCLSWPTSGSNQRAATRQGSEASGPVDRLELLGLLASGTDLKYVQREIKQRGICFAFDQSVWDAMGDPRSAEWLKNQTIAVRPIEEPTVPKREDAAKHLARGMRLAHARQFTEAEREYQAALTLAPDSAVLLSAFGTLLTMQGNYTAAIREYRESIRLDPAFPAAHDFLASALQGSNQTEAAAAEYEEALKLDPDDTNVKIGLGMSLVTLGKYAEALPKLREVMGQAKVLPLLHKYYATALMRTGDIQNGIAEISGYLQFDASDVGAHLLLAGGFAKAGNLSGASEQCREALNLSQNSPNVQQSCQIILGNKAP